MGLPGNKGHLLKDALAICCFPMTRPKGPLESAEASVGLSLLEEAEGRSHTDYHLSIWTWTKKNVFCFVFYKKVAHMAPGHMAPGWNPM